MNPVRTEPQEPLTSQSILFHLADDLDTIVKFCKEQLVLTQLTTGINVVYEFYTKEKKKVNFEELELEYMTLGHVKTSNISINTLHKRLSILLTFRDTN